MRLIYSYSIKAFVALFLMLGVLSCRSTKSIAGGAINKNISAKALIKAHYQAQTDFKTARGRLKIGYDNGDESQNFTVSLRMEKDKAIWMSAPLGIVKVYITPERVSFYNKLQNEYFDGDFAYLSKILGTEVDFSILQNVLLGEAMLDLRVSKYMVETSKTEYGLSPKVQADMFQTTFKISPKNLKITSQHLAQPSKGRNLTVAYDAYQKLGKVVWPNAIAITAIDGDIKNDISLVYRNVELNKSLNFPYTIPKGYKEIVLD